MKNIIYLSLTIFVIFSSCKKNKDEEETKTPEEIYILNDSLVSSPVTFNIPNSSTNFQNPTSINLGDNFMFIHDQGNQSVKRFDYSGNFIDSLITYGSVYLFNNHIYNVEGLEVKKYTEDFTFSSTKYTGTNGINPFFFSSGDDNFCLVNSSTHGFERFNYISGISDSIGSQGNGALQFASTYTNILRYNNLYYVLDSDNSRIQVLNLDGTYNSELAYNSSEFVNGLNSMDRFCFNDTYVFLASSGNAGDQIQVLNRSNMAYIGFIDLGQTNKSVIACTNDKLYVVSNYPTSKFIVFDL